MRVFQRAVGCGLAALGVLGGGSGGFGVGGVGAEILYAGVNSAGGEFAQQNLPGAFGIDYQFINESAIDWFLEQGVNTIRVPFLLERMCPLAAGLGSTFNETYFEAFQKAVRYITMKGAYAVLDAHNYMRYNDPSQQPTSGSIIGSSDPNAASKEQLASFWAELSKRFIANPNVIFGLMNEPHSMPTSLVFSNNQASIDAVRGAGAQQLILVPGNGFAGAQRWLNRTCTEEQEAEMQDCRPNADVMLDIRDPLDNFAFDMHLYFDNDTSGTHEECTAAAPANLVPVTQWLQENNYTAFLSEFGAGSNEGCFQTLNDTLNWMEESDVFVGWTYWAAGPLWGDYFLSVEPGVGVGSGEEGTWGRVLGPSVRRLSEGGGLEKCGVSRSRRGNGLGGVVQEVDRIAEGCLGLRLSGV